MSLPGATAQGQGQERPWAATEPNQEARGDLRPEATRTDLLSGRNWALLLEPWAHGAVPAGVAHIALPCGRGQLPRMHTVPPGLWHSPEPGELAGV